MKRIVSPVNVVGSELYANMTNLKQVINNTTDITSVDNAIAFTAAVEKAFADDKAAQSATQSATQSTTQSATQTPVATQGAIVPTATT
jgi:ribulose kinase